MTHDREAMVSEESQRFRTLVADPPWPLKWSNGTWRENGRGERSILKKRDIGYPTMSIEEICALGVGPLAEDDSHLYLWTPDRFLIDGDAGRVARAWGFDPLRLLVWKKSGFGLGTFPRPQHEAVLVCRRGSLALQVRDVGSVHDWKLRYQRSGATAGRLHSGKPDGFLDLVERASPGPYLELFARRNRLGWSTWGNQALEHVEVTP